MGAWVGIFVICFVVLFAVWIMVLTKQDASMASYVRKQYSEEEWLQIYDFVRKAWDAEITPSALRWEACDRMKKMVFLYENTDITDYTDWSIYLLGLLPEDLRSNFKSFGVENWEI